MTNKKETKRKVAVKKEYIKLFSLSKRCLRMEL